MATTTSYTSNYQIKLIGTGREQGTWGNSTNETIQRIEAAIGKTVSLNVRSMPTGSTSTEATGATTCVWLTVDAADTSDGELGSEGRSRFVEVTGAVDPDVTVTFNIRGSDSTEVPERVLFIKNALDNSGLLQVDGATGTDVTIQNGCYAVLAVVPTTAGGIGAGIHNVMSKLQVDSGLVMSNATAGELEFIGSGTITVPTSDTTALSVSDGTTTFIELDTSTDALDIDFLTITASTRALGFGINTSSSEALDITSGTNSFLTFDTNLNRLTVGKEESSVEVLDIDTATIDVTTQDTTVLVSGASTSAFRISDGVNNYFIVDTDAASEIVTVEAILRADTVMVPASGYVNFGTTALSTGYGVRDNSGDIEVKNSGAGEDWGSILHTNMTSGNALYFKSTANLGGGTTNLTTDYSATEAHDLVTVPKMLRCVLVCTYDDNGYTAGDEIEVACLQDADETSGASTDAVSYGANATNVFFYAEDLANMRLTHVGGGTASTIDVTKWDVYIYAWK